MLRDVLAITNPSTSSTGIEKHVAFSPLVDYNDVMRLHTAAVTVGLSLSAFVLGYVQDSRSRSSDGELVLRDKNGRVRILLTALEDAPKIVMFDSAGRERMAICPESAVAGQAGIILEHPAGGGVLLGCLDNAVCVKAVSPTKKTMTQLVAGDDGAGIEIAGAGPSGKICNMSVTEDEGAKLEFKERSGEKHLLLRSDKQGIRGIEVMAGAQSARLLVDSSGGAQCGVSAPNSRFAGVQKAAKYDPTVGLFEEAKGLAALVWTPNGHALRIANRHGSPRATLEFVNESSDVRFATLDDSKKQMFALFSRPDGRKTWLEMCDSNAEALVQLGMFGGKRLGLIISDEKGVKRHDIGLDAAGETVRVSNNADGTPYK